MTITILIADDDPSLIELMSFNLIDAGFDVITAADGDEAVALATEFRPDVIILDWMMPVMSGIKACRTLRAHPQTKMIPIIMLSARGEESDKIKGLDIGADDYVTKPFSPREVITRIKALLRRATPTQSGEVIAFADLKLDPDRKIVSRGGMPIALSATEFKILSVLLSRPSHVFSRERILDEVWGHGVYIDDRTIDVHVSRLRKTLNTVPDGGAKRPDLIRTIRGSGYALTDADR